MGTKVTLSERLARESAHGAAILDRNESNWGWHTPAGQIRKRRRAAFLAQPLPIGGAAPRVLEVGCGTGTFTGELSTTFSDLTCIDISEPLLSEAARKFPAVRFERQDVHQTTFADARFDLVVGSSVLHHLEWDVALREMARILRPGGRLRFSEPNLLNPQIFLQKNWGWLKRHMGDSPDEYAFTPGQIRESLQEAGFGSIDVRPFEFLHPSTPAPLIGCVFVVERLLEASPLVYFAGSMKITAVRQVAMVLDPSAAPAHGLPRCASL